MKTPDISNIIDRGYALGVKETKKNILPRDDEVSLWWDLNGIKDCSASSAIYKFRLWLKDRSKA